MVSNTKDSLRTLPDKQSSDHRIQTGSKKNGDAGLEGRKPKGTEQEGWCRKGAGKEVGVGDGYFECEQERDVHRNACSLKIAHNYANELQTDCFYRRGSISVSARVPELGPESGLSRAPWTTLVCCMQRGWDRDRSQSRAQDPGHVE